VFALTAGGEGAAPGAPPGSSPRGAGFFLAVLVAAPLLSALACWLPAFAAAQEDPAAILREA
jgi:hypothetical protein